jgi:UPF0755 protein
MKSLRTLLPLLLLAVICLGAILAAGWAAGIPQKAELIYGAPSPALDYTARWRLAWSLTQNVDALTLPADPAGAPIPFTITPGEPAGTVIANLAAAGLIADPAIFRDYLIYTGADTRLTPGEYTLSPALTPLQIAAAIQNVEATGITFVILAGWRLEEVAAALPTSGLNIDPDEFLARGRGAPGGAIAAHWDTRGTHEGLLTPGAYTLPRSLTADALLDVLAEAFLQRLTPELIAGFERQGLTVYEAVTLASIVQREAVLEAEQPRIASVFLNRLRAGWRLDADPTIQYALGYGEAWGWWKAPLSLDDLAVASPYNTYQSAGLPPGPIASPALPALLAVAFPEETPYFYFRAACDASGTHAFAVTFDEHAANACQ